MLVVILLDKFVFDCFFFCSHFYFKFNDKQTAGATQRELTTQEATSYQSKPLNEPLLKSTTE